MKKIVNRFFIFVVFLFILMPVFVHAADDIKSATINGNVFLKGKYVQIGINPNGTLGTIPIDLESTSISNQDKADLEEFALTDVSGGSSLGMRFNKYGWD